MNTNTQPDIPNQTVAGILSSCAVIASIKTTALGLTRQDKQAAKDADYRHGAKEGASKAPVNRLIGADEPVKAIKSKQAEIAAKLKAVTAPMQNEDGQRIMPNSIIHEYTLQFNDDKAECDKMIEDFVNDAPRLIAIAQANLGQYNVAPPTIEEIRDAFSIELVMRPLPNPRDFKGTTLDKAMEDVLRQQFEANMASAYQHAQQDTIKRVAAPLANLVERVSSYSAQEAEKEAGVTSTGGRLYTSVITNLQDMAGVIDSLNLTKDPFIQRISDQISEFEHLDIEDLKNHKQVRDAVTAKAKSILGELEASGWLG